MLEKQFKSVIQHQRLLVAEGAAYIITIHIIFHKQGTVPHDVLLCVSINLYLWGISQAAKTAPFHGADSGFNSPIPHHEYQIGMPDIHFDLL